MRVKYEYPTNSRLYRCWRSMHLRHLPSHAAYERYADKDICEEWQSYQPFMEWALTNGYHDDLEIDRIDNARGYTPDNCRWVTKTENARNRSNSLPPLEYDGEWKTPIEWSEDPRCEV